ncbi:MAG: hypothetical protein D6736_10940, partial [Nitrospinota bacterium]
MVADPSPGNLRTQETAASPEAYGMVIARMVHTEWLQLNGLKRGEFINFPPEELDPLYRYVQEQGLSFGIHLPLFQPSWLTEKGLYLALIDHSPERRELFFRLVEENLQWGKRWGADYLLVHLQRVM